MSQAAQCVADKAFEALVGILSDKTSLSTTKRNPLSDVKQSRVAPLLYGSTLFGADDSADSTKWRRGNYKDSVCRFSATFRSVF